MGTRKKIMIIGAGAGQVPIILASKKRGLFTLVVSPDGPYPGIKDADKWIPLDIYDKVAVLSVAREEQIDYVLSDQSDFAVPTVAYVAEKMGLVGNSIRTAEIYSDKSIQRKFCFENHFSVPRSIALNDESHIHDVPFPFPWVIKPADSQGSRGVCKVHDMNEATAAYYDAQKYSKKGTVMVEEFFEGREVVCEGFVMDGEYHNIAFADRVYFYLPDKFIPSQTIFPSNLSVDIKKKLSEHDTKFAKLANATFGLVHSEYLVNDKGEFRLVETALRGGGVYISSHLIPESTGVDLTELLLDYLIDGAEFAAKRLIPSKFVAGKSAAYICFYLEPGTVTEVEGLPEIKNIPGVIISEIDKVIPGFHYSGLRHKGDRLGPFVVVGDHPDSLMDTIRLIRHKYIVKVKGKKMNALIWD